jgi:Ser/Thr protein kinase RdoA (MazF antagonist)
MIYFDTSYSTLSADALLALVIKQYNIAPHASITFLKRGFNDTYLIEDENKKKYILRVYKHNWRNKASIEGEIELLNHLRGNNVSVSYPLIDIENNVIQQIFAPEGIRHAVLFTFAEGDRIRKLNTEQAYLLGVETAKIHLLTKNYSTNITTAQVYNVNIQFDKTLSTLASILKEYPNEYGYVKKLKEEFEQLFKTVDASQVAAGICHGDLQAENFHITKDNKFTFFDFDFFGKGYLAYDIGVFIWYDHKNKTPEIISSYLKGYESTRKLTATEHRLLAYFSTLRALFQMTLYCNISDGKQLPLWPASEVALFITKVEKWHAAQLAITY